MTARSRKARNQATSGWTETDVKAALAERASYRAWVDRIRLTDVAKELSALEKTFLYRADLISYMVNPSAPQPNNARWEALERRERALAQRFAFMREKLGWVLEP